MDTEPCQYLTSWTVIAGFMILFVAGGTRHGLHSDPQDQTDVPPRIGHLNLAPRAIFEGESMILSGEVIDDPEPSTFDLNLDWGDGTSDTLLLTDSRNFSVQHTYLDDPEEEVLDRYRVSATVHDAAGNPGVASFDARVYNANPELSKVQAVCDNEGHATLDGNATDPGALDTVTLCATWGDDSQPQIVALEAQGSFQLEHSYRFSGDYKINVVAQDSDDGSTSQSLDLAAMVPEHPDLVLAHELVTTASGVGMPLEYRVTARNAGNARATQIALVYSLAPGLILIACDPAPSSAVRGQLVCNLGDMDVDSTSVLVVRAIPEREGTITNSAAATAAEADANDSDNVADVGAYVALPGPGSDLVASVASAVISRRSTRNRVPSILAAKCYLSNAGSTRTRRSTFRAYLSSDAVLDAQDMLVKSAVCSTRGGRIQRISFHKALPAEPDVSGWFLIAVADALGEIEETSEANNVSILGPLE